MSNSENYQVRWRGKVAGPFPVATLRAMLARNEISLMHEVFADSRWIALEELLLKLDQVHSSPVPAEELAPGPPVSSPQGPPSRVPQPPPLPPEELLYVAKAGRQEGPYAKSLLKQLASAGLVSAEDLAWKEGMPEWMPLGRMMADLPRPGPPRPPAPIVGGGTFSPPPTPLVSPVPPPTVAPGGGASGAVAGGYICALISLLLFPPFFALAAFICAIVALVKGKIGHGVAIIILSLVCGIIGMAMGAAVTGG